MTKAGEDGREALATGAPPAAKTGPKPSGVSGFLRLANDGSFALIARLLRETGREFAGRYVFVLILGAITAATAALNAWIIKDVINDVFLDHRSDLLYGLTAIIVANGFVRGSSMYGSAVILGRIGNAIVARTQRRMFDHVLTLGADFFAATPSSELVTRMSYNAQAARRVLDTIFTTSGRDLLSVIGLVTVMIIQSPVTALVILVLGPIVVYAVNQLSRRVRKVARSQFDNLGSVVGEMQQTASAIRIIKAFNLEETARRRMATAIDRVRKNADKIVRIRARTSPVSEILAAVAIGLILFWAGWRSITYGEQPGALISFIAAMAFAFEPAKRLANAQIPLAADVIGVKLMFELLDFKSTMNVNADGPLLEVKAGEVAFKNVDFSYPSAGEVFRGLNFTAPGGKTTALVGPSGGGKSTMISLIERFYDVAGGAILVDGQDIASLRLTSLRDHMALVTQDTVLFHDTIRQNIRFGRPGTTDAEIEVAARDAMAHDFIMATPLGYETILGEGGSGLSGGQRQRIAIARAMLRDAPILLLDEATSALDTVSEHQVQIAFDRLMQGRTTIVIAHRLSTVLGADKIAVLVGGKIVEEGPHAELMEHNAHYARLYHLQFERHGMPPPVAVVATTAEPSPETKRTRRWLSMR